MSWDDEDFEVPTNNAVAENWDDEFADDKGDDEPILESWDASDDDDFAAAPKKKAAATPAAKPKVVAGKKGKKGVLPKSTLNEIDMADPEKRAQLLREAELNSDLNNAADLFGGLGVADEHPRAKQTAALMAAKKEQLVLTKDTPLDLHPIFQCETKQDFEKLRKTLVPVLTKLNKQSQLFYASSLAIDLIRDVAEPLSLENTRKVVSTLNATVTRKQKEERAARMAKQNAAASGPGKKTAKGGHLNLGASSFKKDMSTVADDDYDDDDDDDFM